MARFNRRAYPSVNSLRRDRLARARKDWRGTARPSSGGSCVEAAVSGDRTKRDCGDVRNFSNGTQDSAGSAISSFFHAGAVVSRDPPRHPRERSPPLLREGQQMSVAAARVSLTHSRSLSAALCRPLTRRPLTRRPSTVTSAAMAQKSVSSYLPSDTYNSLPKDGDLTFLHTMLRVRIVPVNLDARIRPERAPIKLPRRRRRGPHRDVTPL